MRQPLLALLAIAVCGLMTWVSWTYTTKIFRIGSHSENAHIPMWMPHSVLAISFECGYDELSSFYRAFKRRTGLPPNEWRHRQPRG